MSSGRLRRFTAAAAAALLVLSSPVAFSHYAGAQQAVSPKGGGATKQMQPADLKAWKTIRASALSSDGKWFAYVLAPNEGDASIVIRSTAGDGKETRYPIGPMPAPGGGGGGRGGADPAST